MFGDLMVQVRDIYGKTVITMDAFDVGKVSGAEMGDQWNITHLHVHLTKDATKELGFKKPVLGHITICLPVKLVKGFGDVVTLSNTKEGLKKIPECQGS